MFGDIILGMPAVFRGRICAVVVVVVVVVVKVMVVVLIVKAWS